MINLADHKDAIIKRLKEITPEEWEARFKAHGYDVIVTKRKDHDDFHCSTKHEDLDDE